MPEAVFRLQSADEPHPVLTWVPVLSALLPTFVLALAASFGRPSFDRFSDLLLAAAFSIIFASGLTYVLLRYFIRFMETSAKAAVRETAVGLSAASAWLVPGFLAYMHRSVIAVVVSIAIGCAFVIWIKSYVRTVYREVDFDDDEVDASQLEAFAGLPHTQLKLSPVLLSIAIHVCVVLLLAQWTMTAALLGGIAGSAFLWSRYRNPQLRHSQRTAIPQMTVAFLLTAIVLLPYLRFSLMRAAGGGSARNHAGRSLEPEAQADAGKEGNTNLKSDYVGIILLPDVKPVTMLVPPPPSYLRSKSMSLPARPLTIPFYGAYWFFRPPDIAPPKHSVTMHGRPDEHTFTSTDTRPLRMTATQNFGWHVPLSNLQGLDITISNADRYPGTVQLELVLADSSRRERPEVSAGSAAVNSANWAAASPLPEVLHFRIPSVTTIDEFDEVRLIFHLSGLRWRTSARIAIDKITFVPKTV